MATAVTTRGARPSRRNKGAAISSGLKALGVPDERGPLFEAALTHRSFAFEQPEPGVHNERLEFLGDAILGAVVTDLIFKTFPELAEGRMAKLRASVVNTHSLAAMARTLGLGPHMRLGKGEEASGGRDKDSLLADTFEAVVGAVYLVRGLEAVRDALVPLFAERLSAALGDQHGFDAKTAFQEAVVRAHGEFPSYVVTGSGPDHSRSFRADAFVAGERVGTGFGRSKKQAEQAAAREGLRRLGVHDRASGEAAPTELPARGGRDARAS